MALEPGCVAMSLNLSCEDASRLVSASHDGILPAAKQARLRLHLMFCAGCRNANLQIGFLHLAMGELRQNRHADAPKDQ